MASPYKGPTFYKSGSNFKRRQRMAQFLMFFREDLQEGTWSVASRFLGWTPESGVSVRVVRNKCHRMFRSAEAEGFIRRMPTRIVSTAPCRRSGRLVRKELAWVLTPEGQKYRNDMAIEELTTP